MRNLTTTVSEGFWPDFKTGVQAAYQAPSRAIGPDMAAGLVDEYESALPSVVACFQNDFEACSAHLRLSVTHRPAKRTTNLLGWGLIQVHSQMTAARAMPER